MRKPKQKPVIKVLIEGKPEKKEPPCKQRRRERRAHLQPKPKAEEQVTDIKLSSFQQKLLKDPWR